MRNRIRIEDVARAAGVSTATVSRALSLPDQVRAVTRERVQAAVGKLGYVPDAAGRALASGRTRTVGCVIPTLDHAIFARSTHAMQTTFAHAGYQLLVASHNYDRTAEWQLVRALQQRGVDALVLVGTDHSSELWTEMQASKKPVLLTWSCDPRLPSVGFDNEAIAALATRHLLQLGHTRIGIIGGHTDNNDRARSRLEGFRKALTQAGLLLPHHYMTEQSLSIAGGRAGLSNLLKARSAPTAVLCGNDLLALGALLEAQQRGIAVPQALSICGIDNHELAGEIPPGLTTVRLPTQDLGQIAADSVLAALRGEPIARRSLLHFELLVRGTTAAPTRKKGRR